MKISKKQKRMLIARTIKFTLVTMLFVGVFTLLGSLGALEVGRIEFQQFIVQCFIGLGLILMSMYSHYRIYEEDYV